MDLDKIIKQNLDEYHQIGNMLSKAIHDINNPLAVFIGQVSILEMLKAKDKLTDEKLENIIEKFHSASNRMKVQLGELREYYKILQSETEDIDANKILTSLQFFFKGYIFKHNLDAKFTLVDAAIPLSVKSPYLFTALKHLILSAMEMATKHETEATPGTVFVKAEKKGKTLIYTIQDNGPGLPGSFEEMALTSTPLAISQHICQDQSYGLSYAFSNGNLFTLTIDA